MMQSLVQLRTKEGLNGCKMQISAYYLHQLMKEHPEVLDPVVLSGAKFGEMPQQRLRFLPLYWAGSIGKIKRDKKIC